MNLTDEQIRLNINNIQQQIRINEMDISSMEIRVNHPFFAYLRQNGIGVSSANGEVGYFKIFNLNEDSVYIQFNARGVYKTRAMRDNFKRILDSYSNEISYELVRRFEESTNQVFTTRITLTVEHKYFSDVQSKKLKTLYHRRTRLRETLELLELAL